MDSFDTERDEPGLHVFPKPRFQPQQQYQQQEVQQEPAQQYSQPGRASGGNQSNYTKYSPYYKWYYKNYYRRKHGLPLEPRPQSFQAQQMQPRRQSNFGFSFIPSEQSAPQQRKVFVQRQPPSYFGSFGGTRIVPAGTSVKYVKAKRRKFGQVGGRKAKKGTGGRFDTTGFIKKIKPQGKKVFERVVSAPGKAYDSARYSASDRNEYYSRKEADFRNKGGTNAQFEKKNPYQQNPISYLSQKEHYVKAGSNIKEKYGGAKQKVGGFLSRFKKRKVDNQDVGNDWE